ncbi:MAG: acyl-CoA dehydrogenase family protein [Myxococcota bacterium]
MSDPVPSNARVADLPRGGAFVLEPCAARRVATPEDFTSEQLAFRKTALDFVRNEVEPRADELDAKAPGLMVDLMHKAAELGLLMVIVPEEYGGLGLDKATDMLLAEVLARVGSFIVTHGAHTGIGTLPIVYYGTEEQKRRYLPRLASGELLAAYALSEPDSGSDALAAKTTARLTADGAHYVLSGTKAWITNAGFADLFIVFAQVDGDKFTAFLVERTSAGLSIGPEEHKLGIRGSSTCQLILDDVKVPATNLLGEIGRGHKIAFNILNVGRAKLGIGCVGAAKVALGYGVQYAKERKQFGKPIASFGLIRQKIGDAATLIYAGESMAYRLAGLIDERTASIAKGALDYDKQARDAIEEFTIEASSLKVFGSEALYKIVDDMLQVHGGNGYVSEYPMERMLRDARINLIFEGTNEINRLIIPATLLGRALKGQLPLMEYVGVIIGELTEPAKLPQPAKAPLGNELWATDLAKRAVVYASSYAAQKYLADLKEKQRLLGALADCLTDVYGMDSVVARARQATLAQGEAKSEIHRDLASLYVFEARAGIFQRLRRVAMMMAEGSELDALYAHLAELDKRYRIDFMGIQDRVAARMVEDGGYVVS